MYENVIIHDSTPSNSYPDLKKSVSEIRQKFCITEKIHILIKKDPKSGPYVRVENVELDPSKFNLHSIEAIVITEGILKNENFNPSTNEEELKAILAHEFSHISHKDLKLKGILKLGIFVLDAIVSTTLVCSLQYGRNLEVPFIEKLGLGIIFAILLVFISFRVYFNYNRELETRSDEEAYCKTKNREALKNAIIKINELGVRSVFWGILYFVAGNSHPSDEERLKHIDALKFD
jgi:Zn-dependent protease with chaperone function